MEDELQRLAEKARNEILPKIGEITMGFAKLDRTLRNLLCELVKLRSFANSYRNQTQRPRPYRAQSSLVRPALPEQNALH